VVDKDRARAAELAEKREKLARHLARVTSVEEATMEEKNPQQGQGNVATGGQGNRSLDQFGTHGGPATGAPSVGQGPGAGEEAEAGEEVMEERDGQEAPAQASDEDEQQGLAARPSPRPKTHKAEAGAKSVRGPGNKANKVGKGARAGRAAAARSAKKGTRGAGGTPKKQAKRPMKTKSRASVRGRPGRTGGKSGGRGAQKGARGKSGAKRRPSPRKGTR
jgi:hypothetical protein